MDRRVPRPKRSWGIGSYYGLPIALLLATPVVPCLAQEAPSVAPPFLRQPDGHPDSSRQAPEAPIDRRGGPGAHPPGSEGRAPQRAQVPRRAAPPATPDERAKRLDDLYAKLKAAKNQEEAAPIANDIEQLWQYAGSPTAELLVARAAEATGAKRYHLARKLLDTAVELQPDYAEAWNRRAYVYYLDDDYRRALGDLRRVLALEPRHYKALEGLAQIMKSVGEKKGALAAYDSLIAIYPAMPGAKEAREELRREVEGQGI